MSARSTFPMLRAAALMLGAATLSLPSMSLPAVAQDVLVASLDSPMRAGATRHIDLQADSQPAIPREIVKVSFQEAAGTIIVNTAERRLYLVLENGKALRYGIGVGRPGFEWKGSQAITMKQEWPDWRPPSAMLKRRPDLPRFMKGGEENPLGARAMYLGSSIYRIHGSNEPDSIGHAVSSGCIRMLNEDVVDLYERVKVGTRVVVL